MIIIASWVRTDGSYVGGYKIIIIEGYSIVGKVGIVRGLIRVLSRIFCLGGEAVR